MKISAFACLLGALLFCPSGFADESAPNPQLPVAAESVPREPRELGMFYLARGEYQRLEEVVAGYMKSKTRTQDGRYALFLLTWGMSDWFEAKSARGEHFYDGQFAEWRKAVPGSALEPIAEAMQIHASAWHARGRGFSSSVSAESWQVFNKRNRLAWQMLLDHKKESATLPTWYQEAISIGSDIDLPAKDLRALFDEGIGRFPGFHPIYFSYTRQLAPRWGGNYADADNFIREQVAAKTNPEGEVLYARLYWLIDQYNGGSSTFFEDSRVSWPRMRAGFQKLMKEFPDSQWNQANFAMYACRANDAKTYAALRPKVDAYQFASASPADISLEICDARFGGKT